MKYCTKCGTPAEDNQNFCLNCGSRLTAPAVQQTAQAAVAAAQNAAQNVTEAAQGVATTAQGQLAAQQQQVAATAQAMQGQLAAQQASAAQAAATVQAQQQAAAEAAAQVAAQAEAQQAAQAAAAQAKSAAEAAAKVEAMRQAANTAGGAETVIAQSQTAAQAAVAQAQAAAQQAVQPAVPVAVPAVQPAVPAANGEKKRSGAGKWLAIIGLALVAVILLIILLVNVLGSSYQTPLKKMVSYMNDQSTDVDDFFAPYPKVIVEFYNKALATAKEGYELMGKSEEIEKVPQNISKELTNKYDEYEEKVGKNLKFSYTIKEKERLDEARLKAYALSYGSVAAKVENYTDKLARTKVIMTKAGMKAKDANAYCEKVEALLKDLSAEFKEISDGGITDGYTVSVKLIFEGKDDSDYEEINYQILKINGKWCIDPLSSGDVFNALIYSMITLMTMN